MAIEFTVDHDETARTDEGTEPLVGWIHFSVRTKEGDYRARLVGGGTPQTLNLLPRKGWLKGDGHLYKNQTSEDPLRLVGNDPAWNLETLTYRVDFDLTTLVGTPVPMPHTYFLAPSTDMTLYLTRVLPNPDQPVTLVRNKVLASVTDILGATEQGIKFLSSDGLGGFFEEIGATELGQALLESEDEEDGRTKLGGTEVGQAVYIAQNKKLARSAMGALGYAGAVDLREWDAILNGGWKTVNGAVFTSGEYTMFNETDVPFTSADVGSIVIANEDHGGVTFTRWMATILDVDNGVATLDTAAPSSTAGQRIKWGPDSTAAVNEALADVNADGELRAAYLPGFLRVTQMVVPAWLKVLCAGWAEPSNLSPFAVNRAGTRIQQLPGAEKNLVVFSGQYSAGGRLWLGPVGLENIALQGPEVNVRDCTPTVGNGLAFRTAGGTAITPQDGVDLRKVHIFGFPESGVEIPGGVVPLTLHDFQSAFNGKYGFDCTMDADTAQMLHLLNCSADGNVLGAARFKGAGPAGSIAVTAFKSEAVPGSFYGSSTGWNLVSGWAGVGDVAQASALIFEDCDQTAVINNGLSHIMGGGGTSGPGPAMVNRSTTGKQARFTYSAVAVRVTAEQEASDDDSVTLRDETTDIDIPRSVASGIYPNDASNVGYAQQSVTTAETLGYFTYLTVLIGSGGVPTLPSAVGMKGARCRLVNVHTADVSAVINGGSVTIQPGASVLVESNGSTWVTMTSASVAQVTHAATSKSTPVDADELFIADSAASWGSKKTTIANIKSIIKTYLEALTGAGLTSLILTTPKVVNYIADSAGAILVGLNSVASAVNYLQISNRATGQKPSITATGSDTDVSGNLASKGAGTWQVNNNEIMTAVRTVNPQTGTSYTLAATDAGHTVSLNNASPVTLDVPTNGTVPMSNGTRIELSNLGAGTVTVTPAGGVTVNGTPGLKIPQYVTGTLTKISANVWLLTGAGLTA